ncbi:MAG TPA: STAS domain-containing protein [Pseudonocardiaceae bacterium]|nr:STAS domain-containing protein [Pseudonocardiaceae bacterium]
MTESSSSGEPADPPAAAHTTSPPRTAAPAGNGSDGDPTPGISDQLLRLTVAHPTVGTCVVTVDGELDMLTAPLLDTCIRHQLAAVPKHLILDLQPVRFLGSTGLSCLLNARELARQTTGTQLHLAGLANRLVERSLQVTELLGLFETYPTLTDALAHV